MENRMMANTGAGTSSLGTSGSSQAGIQGYAEEPLKCEFCSKTLAGVLKLNKHLEKVHDAELDIKCKLCGKDFQRNKHFARHLATEHRMEVQVKGKKSVKQKTNTKKKQQKKTKNEKNVKKGTSSKSGDQEQMLVSSLVPDPNSSNADLPESWNDDLSEGDDAPMGDDDWGWDTDLLEPSCVNLEQDEGPVVPSDCLEQENTPLAVIPEPEPRSPGPMIISVTGSEPKVEAPIGVQWKPAFVEEEKKKQTKPSAPAITIPRPRSSIIEIPYPEPPGPFPCSKCDIILPDYELAAIHKTYHNLKIRVDIQCSKCLLYYKTPEQLLRHSKAHKRKRKRFNGEKKIKRLPCKYCPFKACKNSELKRHVEKHIRTNTCRICNKTVANPRTLDFHMINTHRIDPTTGMSITPPEPGSAISEVKIEPLEEGDCQAENEFPVAIAGTSKFIHCPLCSIMFPSFFAFKKHLASHNPEETFPCELCGRSYGDAKLLGRHRFEAHGDLYQREVRIQSARDFRCDLCKIWITKAGRYGHMLLHGVDRKKLICPVCQLQSKSVVGLQKHMWKNHTVVEPPEHLCTICLHEFDTKELLEEHILKLHKKTFICEVCGKICTTRQNLQFHTSMHHPDGEPSFTCETCGRMFNSRLSLNIHSYNHTREMKPFPCKFCGHQVKSSTHFRWHCLSVHMGPEGFRANESSEDASKEKTFVCGVCSKPWPNQACLDQHLLSHEPVKTFPCRKCPEMFCSKLDMQYHVKETHTIQECEDCGKKCMSAFALRAHRVVHTNVSRYVCHICARIFKVKSDLDYHLAVHAGDYKHICDVCGKAFISKSNLNSHLKTHYGHDCGKCGVSFKTNVDFKKHDCQGKADAEGSEK